MTSAPPTSQIRDRIRELRRVPASELRANPANWRTHPPAQARALQAMLERIGFADALIARETPEGLELIDGHLRADLTPDALVPVLVVDVDAEEALLLLATLDPLSAMAATDDVALAALLAEVTIDQADLEAHLVSFMAGNGSKGQTDPDEVPEPPAEPITKLGDLWLLGEHRLLCGDATDPAAMARLLDGATPILCVTDPPYGVNYDPSWRNVEAAKGNLAYAASRVGAVSNDDRADWTEAWQLLPSDVIYAWHDGRRASEVQAGLEAAGFEIRNQVIWAKPHFPISRGDYHWRHEPCWYAVRRGATSHWGGARDQTTLWELALDANVDGGHSTQKPVELMARPMRNHDVASIVDPFVGSGTAIIAAELTDKLAFAMDIDPAYCDVSVRRWEAFTGETARRG